MKYLIYIPFFLFVGLSFIIGGICWLWKFDSRHFKAGLQFLNKKVRFAQYMDRI